MFFTEPARIPAMWAVLVVLNQLKGRVSAHVMVVGSGLAVMALLAATPFTRPFTPLLTPPLGQWLHPAPPVLLGIMIGLAGRVARPIVAAMALTCVPLVLAPLADITVPYLVGTIAVLAAIGAGWWIPLTSINFRPASACMLGVYLTYIIGLGLAERLVGRGYTAVVLAFTVTFATTWLCQRLVPPARWVTGKPDFASARHPPADMAP